LAELLLTTQWLPKGEEHNTQNNSDELSWGDYGVSGFRKHEIADTLGQGFYLTWLTLGVWVDEVWVG
jgi:hypothetical protein